MEEEGNDRQVFAKHNGEVYSYRSCNSFDEIGLPKQFSACAYILNITSPTPVQSYTIPLALEKKNLFIKAETGSGKTLAFLMPILFNLTRELSLEVEKGGETICHPRCLILAPTRELAMQIHRLCYKLTKVFSFVRCSLVVGGISKDKQVDDMISSQANVVISTPGRTLDLLNLQSSKEGPGVQYMALDRVSYLVIDEADRMLDIS